MKLGGVNLILMNELCEVQSLQLSVFVYQSERWQAQLHVQTV